MRTLKQMDKEADFRPIDDSSVTTYNAGRFEIGMFCKISDWENKSDKAGIHGEFIKPQCLKPIDNRIYLFIMNKSDFVTFDDNYSIYKPEFNNNNFVYNGKESKKVKTYLRVNHAFCNTNDQIQPNDTVIATFNIYNFCDIFHIRRPVYNNPETREETSKILDGKESGNYLEFFKKSDIDYILDKINELQKNKDTHAEMINLALCGGDNFEHINVEKFNKTLKKKQATEEKER